MNFPYSEDRMRILVARFEMKMDELIDDDTPDHLVFEACLTFARFETLFTECLPFFTKTYVGDNLETEKARVMGKDVIAVESQMHAAIGDIVSHLLLQE